MECKIPSSNANTDSCFNMTKPNDNEIKDIPHVNDGKMPRLYRDDYSVHVL